jgi:hypothetical protein
VNIPLAHALQIGAHLISVLASVPVLRALGFDAWHARLTALVFAVSPFGYQAVAWQSPQQPQAVMWVLLAAWAASRFIQSRRIAWLGLSLAAFAAGLLTQESALAMVFVFFWLAALDRRPGVSWRGRAWPLWHLALGALYGMFWFIAPHKAGVTGAGFQPEVMAYLLQAIAFPVSRWITSWTMDWPLTGWTVLFAATTAGLLWGAWRGSSARATLLSIAWMGAGFLPVWAGLSWEYVYIGSRVVYPASLGIAGLWAAWGTWAFVSEQPRWRRALGGAVLALTLATSVYQWAQFQRLYETGTQQLARAVDVLSAAPDKRLLFVNFPDRLELKPRAYPLGFWGLTLAPVVQNLSDYARAETGRSGADRSASSFLVGADERGAWLYRVDMRGEDKGPEALFQSALESDAVYLTRYQPDGALDLQEVGSVQMARSTNVLAALGDSAQLVEASADISASHILTLKLTWRCLGPLKEHDTLFAHFWKDGVFQGDADGDSLGGLIPLTAWKPGTEILDVRQLDISTWGPGRYEVRVGIYNRVDGMRYPARSPDGSRFPDDEAPVYAFTYP